MKLIAESGSSKTDWCILNPNQEVEKIHTVGLNPYYYTKQEVLRVLEKSALHPKKEEISAVYFYGAGCGDFENIQSMQKTLECFFENAQIEVRDDLLAAARSLCQDQAGIVAILGTGSNASFYDGEKLCTRDMSLGYILGDEGSGAYFGKILVQKYLLKQIPESLHQKFINRFGNLSRAEILENIYQKPLASRYLGSFAPFFSENVTETFCRDIISTGFQKLISNYIQRIPKYTEYQVYFVGSIAFTFQEILQEVIEANHLKIGRIEQKPIDNLVKYHQRKS